MYKNNGPTFKVLVGGEGGVGKTTFVKKILTGEFETKYIPTVGVQVYKMYFLTNRGPINFEVWDLAGQESLSGLRDGYYIGADCAILMFDLTSPITFKCLPTHIRDIGRICDSIPTVLVGNKDDIQDEKVSDDDIDSLCERHSFPYCSVSSKSSVNIELPFLYLARKLVGDEHLSFVENVTIMPYFGEMVMGANEIGIMERDLHEAMNCPLPDDPDDFEL
jgi:GTP-binding nuclear protein Ran